MTLVTIINGPNLNLLGEREPETYGYETLKDIENACVKRGEERGVSVLFLQSNAEHELIDWIHQARKESAAIIINPAAFSHTSVAILDALKAYDGLVMEVHLSNIHKRETFRHHSYVSARADAVIAGAGSHGYLLALDQVAHKLNGN